MIIYVTTKTANNPDFPNAYVATVRRARSKVALRFFADGQIAMNRDAAFRLGISFALERIAAEMQGRAKKKLTGDGRLDTFKRITFRRVDLPHGGSVVHAPVADVKFDPKSDDFLERAMDGIGDMVEEKAATDD